MGSGVSGRPGVQQQGTASSDGRQVVWSVLRAGVFGLAAAVAGAVLYTGVVILTGYDIGLVATFLGAGVGFAVVAGHAQLANGWARALSVLITMFSLLLSSYLILWLYDGEGFNPAPISVGEAATNVWDSMVEEPIGLLFWGIALVSAVGIVGNEDPEADDQGLSINARTADESLPIIQLFRTTTRPLRAADLKLVVVTRTPTGGFRLRWVSLVASDLPSALPHLFDADPGALAQCGTPANPCRVEDQEYDSAEEAIAAAGQRPGVDPKGWGERTDFISFVEDDARFADMLKPDAERIGALGAAVVCVAGLAVAVPVIYAGYRLDVWVGLDTAEREGTLPDVVFSIIVIIIGGALGLISANRLARPIARRNLAKAMAEGGIPNVGPDAGTQSPEGPMSLGHRTDIRTNDHDIDSSEPKASQLGEARLACCALEHLVGEVADQREECCWQDPERGHCGHQAGAELPPPQGRRGEGEYDRHQREQPGIHGRSPVEPHRPDGVSE